MIQHRRHHPNGDCPRRETSAATYPAIVKPRQGRGSRGLAFLDGAADLRAYLGAAAKDADQYIVQERLLGPEFTTSVVVGLDGKLLAIVPKEAADKRGITQVGITRNVPAIDVVAPALLPTKLLKANPERSGDMNRSGDAGAVLVVMRLPLKMGVFGTK